MHQFFRSGRMKIMIAACLVIVIITVITGAFGATASPLKSLFGAISTPFQNAGAKLSSGAGDFFGAWHRESVLKSENSALQSKIDSLTSQVVADQQAIQQNEFYKQFLQIKTENPTFEMLPSQVVSVGTASTFYAFQINKGSIDGVALHDVVLTPAGLAGYVTSVSPTFSIVTTVLDPSLHVPVHNNRTGEAGVSVGDTSLITKTLFKLTLIDKDSSAVSGDYIVTTGGNGIFPQGLIIGTLNNIEQNTTDTSKYAILSPSVDFKNLSNVMVITYFKGQNNSTSSVD